MIDDVAINKAEIVRRCLSRVREEYREDPSRLDDFTIQDSIVLNLQRACEACIDLAMHRVSMGKLDVPQSSRDAFDLLQGQQLSDAMKRMVGFRNIAVHSDEKLHRSTLEAIVCGHLSDFENFLTQISPSPHP